MSSLPGVYQLRTVAECDAIRQVAKPGARAVVVGMGFIGSEVAASLRQMGLEVTAVLSGAAPLATVLGNEVAAVLAAIHREHGVRLVTNDQVIGFEGGARADGQGSFYLTQGTLQAEFGLNRGGDPELEADAELRACQDLIRGRIRLSEAALADDRMDLQSLSLAPRS